MMRDKQKPKVGVALLAYNQGKYIDEMIDSLKKQTFQDFEVFLSDDGSTDGFTPEKIKTLTYAKIRRKIIDNKNLGNAERRKRLYKIIDNEYIIDLSADDVLDPKFLERSVEFLDHNKDYGAVSTNLRMFETDIADYYYEHHFDMKKMILPYELARNYVLGSSLMRREALSATDLSGGFTRYQDWDRWISMLEKGWKIGLVDEPLFYYRQVKSSLSHSASIDDELEIRGRLLKKHAKSYRKYYKDVILDMEHAFLEMKEGKDWLDGQYHWLTKENEELRKKLQDYDGLIEEANGIKEKNNKNEQPRLTNIWKRVFSRGLKDKQKRK